MNQSLPGFPQDFLARTSGFSPGSPSGVRAFYRATAMKEQWKPFADGKYSVSSRGRLRREIPGRVTPRGKIHTPTSIMYPQIHTTVNGKYKTFRVHRLVAEAFIGPCPDGMEVNHIDGVKANNSVENLEYVTHGDNVNHACAPDRPHGCSCHSFRRHGKAYQAVASRRHEL